MAQQQSALIDHAAAIDIDRRLEAAGIIQEVLTDLINLSLQGKQAHWNLRGRTFRELHLQLDELVDLARAHSDLLAERCLALGIAADGRAREIADTTHLDPFPEGRVPDTEVVELMLDRLKIMSEVGRSRLGRLGMIDPVSQDLVNAVLADMEKQLWMFEANRPEVEEE